MSTRFVANHRAFAEMAMSTRVQEICHAEAERAKRIAEGMSQDFRVTGEYADSFVVEDRVVPMHTRAGAHPVAGALLRNMSDHAAAVEFGNQHDHRPHRVLQRTIEAVNHHD